MLPALKVDVVFEREKDLEADTGADMGPDGDTGVEELRSGNGVEEDDRVLYRLEELRLPLTASADVVVVTLSFKLGKTLENAVVEKGGVVTAGALEFVAWTLLYGEEVDDVGAEITESDES